MTQQGTTLHKNAAMEWEKGGGDRRTFSQHPSRRMLKQAVSKAAADGSTGGVTFPTAHPTLPRQLVSQVGYVEDAFEARTKLAACFSILLIQRGVEGHIRVMAIVVA